MELWIPFGHIQSRVYFYSCLLPALGSGRGVKSVEICQVMLTGRILIQLFMRVDDINDGSSLRFKGIVLFSVASVLFSIGGTDIHAWVV